MFGGYVKIRVMLESFVFVIIIFVSVLIFNV